MAWTYRFIRVTPAGDGYWIWNLRAVEVIGHLDYYPRWRQWVFRAEPNTVWSAGCLADVQDAMRKAAAAKKGS